MSLMTQINLIVLMTNSLGTLSHPSLLKVSFPNQGGLIAALNRKRQYMVIILIIIIVIIEHLFI